MTISLEVLYQKFEDQKELSIIQHTNIVEKIDHLEKKMDNKIIPLEKSSEEFQTWKSYIIAIIILIGFITPIATSYLWH